MFSPVGYSDYNTASKSNKKNCKSPVKMQKHLEKLPPVPFDQQVIKACDWIKESMCYDEKILCIGHEIPAKLQDGPQCGIVALWMAGQHLDPDCTSEVEDIQGSAIEKHYTKHGEMFSAKNMANLAKQIYNCDAEKIKGSYGTLTSMEKLLNMIAKDEKMIMVPYDSDSTQWPCMRKGHKAHWGVIFGIALIMPSKNKVVVDKAQYLDGFVSYLKPPLSQESIDLILKDRPEIKYLLMVRQSKSKRIFLFNSRQLAESNNNLVGYSDSHRHHQLFLNEGFIMPPGGIRSGLKGQLVILNKIENNESEQEEEEEEEYEWEYEEEEDEDEQDKQEQRDSSNSDEADESL